MSERRKHDRRRPVAVCNCRPCVRLILGAYAVGGLIALGLWFLI